MNQNIFYFEKFISTAMQIISEYSIPPFYNQKHLLATGGVWNIFRRFNER